MASARGVDAEYLGDKLLVGLKLFVSMKPEQQVLTNWGFWPTALQCPALPYLPSSGAAPGNDGAMEERAVPDFRESGEIVWQNLRGTCSVALIWK